MLCGAGNAACRSIVVQGKATALPPLNPTENLSSVKMFSQQVVRKIKTDFGPSVPGIRFTRDGEGSKFIPSSCNIGFVLMSNKDSVCQKFTVNYSDKPAWKNGDHDACGKHHCTPLGTDGGDPSHLKAMGLYDSANCFDAWAHGKTKSASVWVR